MIQQTNKPAKLRAVGMISGGLDSVLAAKIIKDLDVDVHGLFMKMPWGCCDQAHAQQAADSIGIPLIVLQLDERYLQTVQNPRHGRGTAMNPCVDCRIHMFRRAAKYMRHINADFVFTGEVVGQRMMSQKKQSMSLIARQSGLEGRLLRPLCAGILEPTIMETSGQIDRQRMMRIAGRSRKPQYLLAKRYQIDGYSAPAGGCLLTDSQFSRRIQDVFEYGYRNFRETISLKWGRHYRLSPKYKCILGRNMDENTALIRYAHPDDIIMQLPDNHGPTLILKGVNPSLDILTTSAGILQRFSKHKYQKPIKMTYWKVNDRNTQHQVPSKNISESDLKEMKV